MKTLPTLLRSFLAVAALALTTDAQVLHVDDDAANDPGPNDPTFSDPLENGSSLHPFDRIQEAISAASPGTEIRVAAGTYVDFATITLEGKAVWLHGVDGADVTIVDATTLNDRVLRATSGETAATVVQGLTLRGGVAVSAAPNDRGAGLYVDSSSVTVRDCVLEGDRATYGGALYANLSTGTVVERCRFEANDAFRGGALYANNSSLAFTDCEFDDNASTDHGGVVFATGTTLTALRTSFLRNASATLGGVVYASTTTSTFTECAFEENGAIYGGALYVVSSATTLEDCTLERNVGSTTGSAVYKAGSPTLSVARCRFTENDAQSGSTVTLANGTSDRIQGSIFNGNLGTVAGVETYSGHVVEVWSSTFAWNPGIAVKGFNANFRVRSCILWGNAMEVSGAVSVEYCDVTGGFAGAGNLDVDPLFRVPFGADGIAGTADDDLRLFGASPCIDAGDTLILGVGSAPYPIDFAGNPRAVDREINVDTGRALLGQTIDMGAFEFPERCRPVPTRVP